MNNLNHITNLKQLIRITIDDVKLVEGDDRYDFNITEWHNPNISTGCAVCLAGSIMAKTLKSDIGVGIAPLTFDRRTEVLLYLIDQLRDVYKVIYLQNLLNNCDVEFDLNNLSELDLDNYDLKEGDMGEWERLYSDLK